MPKKYIELDAALAALGEEPCEWVDYSEALTQEHNDWECHYKAISAIPAADVVEVRHGRWREVENGESGHLCECSACKEWMLFYYGFVANYCPSCGAKMDGDRK